MDKKFNELLKSARLKAGLTQAQLAEKIGVPKSTYCNWEQGTREPNVLKLKQIARALGVLRYYHTYVVLGKVSADSFHSTNTINSLAANVLSQCAVFL